MELLAAAAEGSFAKANGGTGDVAFGDVEFARANLGTDEALDGVLVGVGGLEFAFSIDITADNL